MMLVSPDGSCYVVNDTGPDGEDVAQLADRRADLPSKRANLEQMFGWKPSPHGVRRKVAEDWQLLQDVKWAERAGEFIPLIGSGANALKIFNKERGTSHILDGSFRKFLTSVVAALLGPGSDFPPKWGLYSPKCIMQYLAVF